VFLNPQIRYNITQQNTYISGNVIDTVRVYLCDLSVLLQPLETALVRTNYTLSEAKPRIHLLFVRSTSASNGCKRTLWKKKRVQVSDLYDNNWLLFWQKKNNRINKFDIYM